MAILARLKHAAASARSVTFGLVLSALLLPSAAHAAKQVTYYQTDQNGTVLATTDEAGNILTQSDRRPYGEQVMGTPDAGPGYTGHVDDPDTGLVYMQARYYDPAVGRFISRDPVGVDPANITSFNRYRYAANNPINVTDPDGRQDCRSCEMSYGAAVGIMLRNDPERLKAWQAGEAAATTARGAQDGAGIGVAVGKFVDTGDYSNQAVASAAMSAVLVAVTHGKLSGPMHGPAPHVHPGKQGKHIVGHNNFNPKGTSSILTGDPHELARWAGTGQQVGNLPVGTAGSKERINFGKEIGQYYDEATKAHVPTTNATIRYAKEDIHIVPARP